MGSEGLRLGQKLAGWGKYILLELITGGTGSTALVRLSSHNRIIKEADHILRRV